MAADISSAAGYKNLHKSSIVSIAVVGSGL